MKAFLRNYRQSPRKVRLVANLVKGKSVSRAHAELDSLPKKSSKDMKKLLASAEANAKNNNGADPANLVVENVTVDAGITMKRYRPGWRGIAFPYKKRTSNISLTLKDTSAKEVTKKAEKKEEAPKKEVAKKKPVAKKTTKQAKK